MSQFDYEDNTIPKCPHCGVNFPVWDGDHPLSIKYEDGGRTTFDCERCEKPFVCVTGVIYTFSTATSDERADDQEWGPPEEPETDDGSEALPGLPL